MSECRPVIEIEHGQDVLYVCESIGEDGQPDGDAFLGWDSKSLSTLIPKEHRAVIGNAIANTGS